MAIAAPAVSSAPEHQAAPKLERSVVAQPSENVPAAVPKNTESAPVSTSDSTSGPSSDSKPAQSTSPPPTKTATTSTTTKPDVAEKPAANARVETSATPAAEVPKSAPVSAAARPVRETLPIVGHAAPENFVPRLVKTAAKPDSNESKPAKAAEVGARSEPSNTPTDS